MSASAAAASARGADSDGDLAPMSLSSAAESGAAAGDAGSGVSERGVDELLADSAGALVQQALLPNAVWRVGLVASTIRKVACACVLSLCQRGLLPLHALGPVFGELAPVLAGCLGDDDATTRHVACLAMASMLSTLRGALDGEAVRQLYPELLKRLDDSNDAVRASGCRAIAALATAAARPLDPGEGLAGTPGEFTIDTLLVHLDDPDAGLQAAVFESLQPYVRLFPAHARKALAVARAAHRHPGLCDRLLAFVNAL